jgi:hypothetical protein
MYISITFHKPKKQKIMIKEILTTALAVAIGIIIAKILSTKVPFLAGQWEEWEE